MASGKTRRSLRTRTTRPERTSHWRAFSAAARLGITFSSAVRSTEGIATPRRPESAAARWSSRRTRSSRCTSYIIPDEKNRRLFSSLKLYEFLRGPKRLSQPKSPLSTEPYDCVVATGIAMGAPYVERTPDQEVGGPIVVRRSRSHRGAKGARRPRPQGRRRQTSSASTWIPAREHSPPRLPSHPLVKGRGSGLTGGRLQLISGT